MTDPNGLPRLPATFGRNVPILGQNTPKPDRFEREYGAVHNRDGVARGDIQDSEYLEIEAVWKALKKRVGQHRNYDAFDREIKDRFFKIGWAVDVIWAEYAIDGVKQDGYQPKIEIVGRVQKTTFDHDQKVHEITSNLLELPGQEKGQVLKANKADFEAPKGHQH